MDYISAQAKVKRDGAAAAPRFSAKEYKKASPVRAKLRAAVAWAKK